MTTLRGLLFGDFLLVFLMRLSPPPADLWSAGGGWATLGGGGLALTAWKKKHKGASLSRPISGKKQLKTSLAPPQKRRTRLSVDSPKGLARPYRPQLEPTTSWIAPLFEAVIVEFKGYFFSLDCI